MSGDHNMHCSANQPDCYGDGNVYRGVCSKDSEVKTILVGYADKYDLENEGHDFYVSRQQSTNSVPIYMQVENGKQD